jgi:hypothetical protein
MENNDKIVELYKNLLLNLELISNYDYSFNELNNGESGFPDASYSTIALIYSLIKKNNKLLEIQIDENNLFSYLIKYVRLYLKSRYDDYVLDHKSNITLDDYKLNKWINIKEKSSDYYYSNDAYNLYGITGIQLRKLLIMSRNLFITN